MFSMDTSSGRVYIQNWSRSVLVRLNDRDVYLGLLDLSELHDADEITFLQAENIKFKVTIEKELDKKPSRDEFYVEIRPKLIK